MAVDAQRKMYVIMPQKILDLFNVHTALYQTGGVGVAKLVGRDAKGQLRDVLLRLPGGDALAKAYICFISLAHLLDSLHL